MYLLLYVTSSDVRTPQLGTSWLVLVAVWDLIGTAITAGAYRGTQQHRRFKDTHGNARRLVSRSSRGKPDVEF